MIKAFDGPLHVCRNNPRYFADNSGQPVYLTGSHTWQNLSDIGPACPPATFDYERFLNLLGQWGHNCFRLWRWELINGTAVEVHGTNGNYAAPHPWTRSGPDKAVDGLARFDLSKLDEKYFARLRSRVQMALDKGMYVIVMLFEGWALRYADRMDGHPFCAANNVNSVDCSRDLTEIQTLDHPDILRIQEAYARKVVDTVNGFDNVLYEISNETSDKATDWQYHMIGLIKQYEQTMPTQHPVGMTFQYVKEYLENNTCDTNDLLLASPADWISPGNDAAKTYRNGPPPATGDKVFILDTDHLWGIGGNPDWVWRSFTRGYGTLYMDTWDTTVKTHDQKQEVRLALGYTRCYAERMDLANAIPQTDLASTGYALANPGREYLIYVPVGRTFTAEIVPASYIFEWFDCKTGTIAESGTMQTTGGQTQITSPISGPVALYLARAKS